MIAKFKKSVEKLVAHLIPNRRKEARDIKQLIFELIYNVKMEKKYNKFVDAWVKSDVSSNLKREKSNKVWVCWFQGVENMPEIVQACYHSLLSNLKDKEIILLTDENVDNYVCFPAHIKSKYEKGIISKTHYSDLLRLELLIQYGGVWIDATILCTGENIPRYILESDLFVYQWLNAGAIGCTRVASSWFIASCTNHPILLLTRALLYQYWKTSNKMKCYFLFHQFFELATRAYPEDWKKVIQSSNVPPLVLSRHLFEPYDEYYYEAMKSVTNFHKLTYKFNADLTMLEDTYYKYILKSYNNETENLNL